MWDAWAQSGGAAPATPLRDFLVSKAIEMRQVVSAGTIKMNSSNGHITEFERNGITQSEAVQIWVYLVDEFDRAQAQLSGTPTDTQVKIQMEANLRPVKNYSDNWMFQVK